MESLINSYTEELDAYIEDQARLRGLKQDAATPRHVKPLDAQITELMRALPPKMRNRPWSMAELVQRLVGKYRERPHAQRVGESLRRLNWKRERRWGKGWDGQRVWVPD